MNDHLAITSTTGIDLNLAIAGPGARSYAFVIDWHIRLLLALAWFLVAGFLTTGGIAVLSGSDDAFTLYAFTTLIPTAVIYFLYHPVLEVVMRGRTPGKRMAGIRVVTALGEEPSVMAILIRNTLRLLDSLPIGYMIGLITTMFTAKSVRVGDLAAGTLLIYSEDKQPGKDAVAMTPGAIARYGLDHVELAADLLERWDGPRQPAACGPGTKNCSQLRPGSGSVCQQRQR